MGHGLGLTSMLILASCAGNIAASVTDEDLIASEPRELAGKWQSCGGDLNYQVSLTFDPGACTQGGAFAFVWRVPSGGLQLCVKIPRDAPLDSLRKDQYFVLNVGTSSAPMLSNACA